MHVCSLLFFHCWAFWLAFLGGFWELGWLVAGLFFFTVHNNHRIRGLIDSSMGSFLFVFVPAFAPISVGWFRPALLALLASVGAIVWRDIGVLWTGLDLLAFNR
jgi:hypothetical protein